MRPDSPQFEEAIRQGQRWAKAGNLELRLRKIQQTTEVKDMHGTVLPTKSEYRPVPKLVLDTQNKQILLTSAAINVVGSFAETIDDAGFTHFPAQDHTTIYWDGTNQSRRIVRRRADGFKETLPAGHILIDKLPMGAEGAPGPMYLMFPYFIPGTCNIGWVTGTVGIPMFCHLKDSNDARQQQRILGREPLSDGPFAIQLLPVPAPPPPPDPTLPPPDPPPPPVPAPVVSPTAPPTYTPPPVPPGGSQYCVMKGTEIVPIGSSPWWIQEHPQNDWVIVTTAARSLTAVPEHRIATGRAGWTEMRDVRKGDIVLTVEGEEKVQYVKQFARPGVKVSLMMERGHTAWFNGILGHNAKKVNPDGGF